jgi:hypothetical protein
MAQAPAVATGDLTARFPEPLPMPQVNLEGVWAGLADQIGSAMPTPPPMPVIDWAQIAPPMPEIPAISQASANAGPAPGDPRVPAEASTPGSPSS